MGNSPRLDENEKKELRLIAENFVAVQIAREVLDSAPPEDMGEKEKEEFERMRKIVDFAAELFADPDKADTDPGLEEAAESWNAFLHIYMKSVLQESANIRKRIENIYDSLKAETEGEEKD